MLVIFLTGFVYVVYSVLVQLANEKPDVLNLQCCHAYRRYLPVVETVEPLISQELGRSGVNVIKPFSPFPTFRQNKLVRLYLTNFSTVSNICG
jgi:hypothetical protein